MGFVIGLAVVAVIVLALGVSLFNQMIRARNEVDNWLGQVDVALQRRHDLIPNLVETVRGYATHERETLERVTRARERAVTLPPGSTASFEAQRDLTRALLDLRIVAERYPELRADALFRSLLQSLDGTEDMIARSRQFYNDAVKRFRDLVEQFPGSLLAGLVATRGLPAYYQADAAAATAPRVAF